MNLKKISRLTLALVPFLAISCSSTDTKKTASASVTEKTESTSAKLLMSARVDPHMEGDAITGYSIQEIEKNSAWEKAGFKNGDVVTKLYGKPLNSDGDLVELLRAVENSPSGEIEVLRKEPGDLRLKTIHLGIIGS